MPKKPLKFISLIVSFLLLFEQSGFAAGGGIPADPIRRGVAAGGGIPADPIRRGVAQIAAQSDVAGYLSALRNSFTPDKFRPLHLRYLQYNSQANTFKLLLDKGDWKNQKKGHSPAVTVPVAGSLIQGKCHEVFLDTNL